MAALRPGTIVQGFETNTVAAMVTELVARAQTAMEIAAVRVEINLKRSANRYTDTGEMRDGVSVEVIGGLGGFGAREVGMIAVASAPHSEWVDKGTGTITPKSAPYLAVGRRRRGARRNAPAEHVENVYFLDSVSGQEATGWFSSPFGVPLGEHMRNTFAGIFRRLR